MTLTVKPLSNSNLPHREVRKMKGKMKEHMCIPNTELCIFIRKNLVSPKGNIARVRGERGYIYIGALLGIPITKLISRTEWQSSKYMTS